MARLDDQLGVVQNAEVRDHRGGDEKPLRAFAEVADGTELDLQISAFGDRRVRSIEGPVGARGKRQKEHQEGEAHGSLYHVRCATLRYVPRASEPPRAHLATVSDPHDLLQAGRFDELAHDEHPLWRGLALLELRRFSEAARVFEEAEGAEESGTMLEFAGAARWLSGERGAAAERWIAALDAAHDGPAGIVKPPALVLYAGLRIPDERYVLRGKRLLGKLWKPKIARVWPGPVAGYLLGNVDEQSFLDDGYEDPDLEARRLASARFWAGVNAQDPAAARKHFEGSASLEGASALEVEHHLAKGEVK